MTEVPVTDWANYEGDLPERYPHRQPRPGSRLGRTSPITGPDFGAYRKEKRRRLKASSPTLTVAKVEPDDRIPTFNKITFENGIVTGYPKSKNAKVGDKFVVSSQDGRFAHIMDAEGNIPFHLANTMDASQQEDTDELKDRASSYIIADYIQDLAEWGFNHQDHTLLWDTMCMVIEADERGEFEEHIDMLEDNYESEEGNAPIQDPMEFGEMANWTPLDGSEGLKRKRAESPSATIPANEPSWVKPVATALGFALGFFGIHEIKKVL